MQQLRISCWAKWAVACFVSCFIFTATADVDTTIRIVLDATDSVKNGTTLAQAIATQSTAGGGVIYLGAGTFNGNFLIKDGVKIYGGFTGTDSASWNHETSTRDRTLTICDGSNAKDANTASVFYAMAIILDTAILDGLTIQNGKGSKDAFDDISGGGVNAYNSSSKVEVNDCIISNNTAKDGGGMYRGTATNCIITHNTATKWGGGMYFGTATNCIITNNKADR